MGKLAFALAVASATTAHAETKWALWNKYLGGTPGNHEIANILWNNCVVCHNSLSHRSGLPDFTKMTKPLSEGGNFPGANFDDILNVLSPSACSDGYGMPRTPGCKMVGGEAARKTLQEWLKRARDGKIPSEARDPETLKDSAKAVGLTGKERRIVEAHWKMLDDHSRSTQIYISLGAAAGKTVSYGSAMEGGLQIPLSNLCEAAVSKMINSLHFLNRIVKPERIPGTQVVTFNLKDLGWSGDSKEVSRLLSQYGDRGVFLIPNSLSGDTPTRPVVMPVYLFLTLFSSQPIYKLFLRPRLINNITNEKAFLSASMKEQFDSNGSHRSLFQKSGVSRSQQRVVEESSILPGGKIDPELLGLSHRKVDQYPKEAGYYWKTFDFIPSDNLDLSRHPLGPYWATQDNRSGTNLSFAVRYSESIFTLPDGLQGYLLGNSANENDDVFAQTELVRDSQGSGRHYFDATRESTEPHKLINTISCVGCHQYGMILPPGNEVNPGDSKFRRLPKEARDRLAAVYQPKIFADALLRSRTSFLKAMKEVVTPFVKAAEVESIPEVIRECADNILDGLAPSGRDNANAYRKMYLDAGFSGFTPDAELNGLQPRQSLSQESRAHSFSEDNRPR